MSVLRKTWVFPLVLLFVFNILQQNLCAQNRYFYSDQFHYLFPFPDADEINPATQLIIKHKTAFAQTPDETLVRVMAGDESSVSGKIRLMENNHTLIFIPDKPFGRGDHITIHVEPLPCIDGRFSEELSYSFTVKNAVTEVNENDFEENLRHEFPTKPKHKAPASYGNIILPEGYPFYEIGLSTIPTPDQYYFQASQVGRFFQLITDNKGVPYFYRETPSRCLDFKVNKNGFITYFDASLGHYAELDSAYRFQRVYKASPGLETDNHELVVMPNGNYWTIGKEYIMTDMSQYVECGSPNATVLHFVIEEKDPTGVVLWQWRTYDHFNVMDGDTNQVNFCGSVVNFCHINSIAHDEWGNVILSSRRMNEVTKISKSTGNILWRLGGLQNQFSLVGDPLNGFTDQHMAREDVPGEITIFDNGNYHNPPHSRGVKYLIDTVSMTATYLTGYDDNDPVIVTNPMGSMQQLPNGNVVLGWTQNAQGMSLTEYDPDGTKVLEMHQSDDATLRSYRSFKFPWKTTFFYPENDSVDFGNQVIAGSVATQTVNIVNPNNQEIEVTGSYFNNQIFGLQTDLPFSIPANSASQVTFTFHPLFDGEYSGFGYLMSQTDSTGIALRVDFEGSTLQSGLTTNEDFSLGFYPNPFSHVLHLTRKTAQPGQIRIVDSKGMEIQVFLFNSQTDFEIDTRDWKAGVYVIEYQSGNHSGYYKLIKQ